MRENLNGCWDIRRRVVSDVREGQRSADGEEQREGQEEFQRGDEPERVARASAMAPERMRDERDGGTHERGLPEMICERGRARQSRQPRRAHFDDLRAAISRTA